MLINIATSITVTAFTDTVTGDPMGYQYQVRAMDEHGHPGPFSMSVSPSVTSSPTILTQPASISAHEGNAATFTVEAVGAAPLSYQWLRDGAPIANATGASYTLNPTTFSIDNGAQFSVTITNSSGSQTSSAATLTVIIPVSPSLTTPPVDVTVVEPNPATLSVVASGTEPLTYQWFEDGIAIPHATSATYTLTQTSFDADTGKQFSVRVGNVVGSVTTQPVTLTVNPHTVFYQSTEANGLISLEGENFYTRQDGQVGAYDYTAHNWQVIPTETQVSMPANASGGEAVTTPNFGTPGPSGSGYNGVSPQLNWIVHFTKTGTHYVWVRGHGPDPTSDSFHLGIDGQELAETSQITGFSGNGWKWSNKSKAAKIDIQAGGEGLHAINAWMREDGFILDKIVLTTDASYEPWVEKDEGPDQSPTVADEQNPTPPANVQVTTVSASELLISWGSATDDIGIVGYEIRRCQGASPCANPLVISVGLNMSHQDSGLNPSTTYWYDVIAKDGVGKESTAAGALGTTNPDTQAPDPPSDVAAGTVTGTAITLMWSKPFDNVGVVGYEVQRCTGSGCTNFADFSTAKTALGTVFEDSEVSASTTYRYQVRAKDASGNISAPGQSADVTTNADGTPPSGPLSVQVTPLSHTELAVTWDAATDAGGIQKYVVTRCLVADCTSYDFVGDPASASTINDGNRQAGTAYRYRVIAQDVAGNWGAPAFGEGMTLQEPIEYFVESGGLVTMEAENFQEKYAGKDVPGGQDYSGHAWTEVSTPAGASGGKGMSASPKNNTPGMNAGYAGVVPQMDWIVNFSGIGTYYVWLRGQGQGSMSDSVHFGIDGAETASGKKVDGFSNSDWSWENTSGSSVRTVEVTTAGLHTFNIWMREDGFILDKIVLTKNDETIYIPTGEGPAESSMQLDALAPSAPAPTVVNLQASHVTVDWEPSTDDVQVLTYAISRCEGSGCVNFANQGEIDASTTEYPDSGLTMNTTYRYKVVAIDGVGHESAPGIVEVTTPPDQSAPTPPEPVGVAHVGGATIHIIWTPSQDDGQVVAYDVRRCVGANPCTSNDLIQTVGGTTYEFSDSGLQTVTTYRYEIIARDAAGNESNPGSIVVTTNAQTPPSAVSNAYPADGATDISRYPTLEGSCGAPGMGIGAAQYRIAVDSQMSSVVYDSGESPNDLCSHVAVAGLNSSTQYFWHMRIKNTNEDWSAWSSATSFTTTSNTSSFLNVFQDGIAGYTGTRDADIRGNGANPTGPPVRNWNQGKQDVLRTGRRVPGKPTDEIYRSLVKFDVSALTDPNAVVTAYVELTGWTHGSVVHFLAPNSMYELIRPWGEGLSVADVDANEGEVSWQYAVKPDVWAINGAAYAHDNDPNADREETPLVKLVATNQVGYKTLWSSQALIDTVKNWIANPEANQGLLIKADDEGIQIPLILASREHTSAPYRPRLVIVSSEQAFQQGNQPPIAVLDTIGARQGAAVLVPVLSNDFDPDNSPSGLVIDQIDVSTNGTVEIIGDHVRYTPHAGFEGTDTFAYTVSDGTDKASAMIRVTVTGPVLPNQAPLAVNDGYSLPSGSTQLTVDAVSGVLANDSDPENSSLTAILVSGPSHGSLIFNPDGSLTYTPNPGFGGTESFQYQAFDGVMYSSPATVTLSINGQPQTADDATHTPQGTAIVIAVLANDTDDVALDPATVVVQSAPAEGATNVNTTTGEITYTASSNVGLYSFTYTVKDDQGYESAPATVTVDVTPANNVAPNATGESYNGNQDAVLSVVSPGVLGNDSDPNYDAMTAVLDTNASNGTVTLNADGGFIYTPNTGFSGTDSFTYHAHDGELDSPVVTVTLDINGKPVANADTAITLQNASVVIAVLSNDTDDQMPVAGIVTVVSGPANGTANVDTGTGKVTYTPTASFLGADTFTYTIEDAGGLVSLAATVTIDVTNGNVPPVVDDDAYTGDQENAIVVASPGVLANDSDLNDDPITAVLVAGPTNGSVTLNANGSFTYTPNSGFNGQDSFTYVANDGTVDSAVATVGLTIAPPIAVSFQEGTAGYTGTVDTFLRGAAPTNSHGGQARIRWNINEDKYGLIRFENIFGSGAGQIPSDVTIQSATLILTVSDAGDAADIYEAAVDWAENESFDGFGGDSGVQPDELGALIRAANGETAPSGAFAIDVKESLNRWVADPTSNYGWIFVPTATNGVDVRSRSYGTVAERPRLEVSYTLGITNQAPVAGHDSYGGNQDVAIMTTAPGVLSNDGDPNLDPITAILDANPSNGALTLNADGGFTYTPNAGFSGTDSFTYHAHDGELDSQVATVTLTINGRPAAINDDGITLQDVPVGIPVLDNDTDDTGLVPSTVTVTSGPANGTTSVETGTGRIVYTPAMGFLGFETFTYTVEYAEGFVSNAATVAVEVTNANLPPVVTNDVYTGNQDAPLFVVSPGVLSNDTDPNADPLTATLVVQPSNGTVMFNENGSFTYTPNTGFNGMDSFTYVANDGTANSASATVTLTIVPPVTVTFQHGANEYIGAVDTFLRGAAPDNSHGGQARIRWSTNESKSALLRFENMFGAGAGKIPVGATIQSATLRLVASDDGTAADIHESAVNWDETTTFNNFGGDPDVQVDELGPLIKSGGGMVGASAFTVDVTESLARWAADPTSNYGWIFIPTGSNGVDVRSRSYATVADRPRLEVTYTVDP